MALMLPAVVRYMLSNRIPEDYKLPAHVVMPPEGPHGVMERVAVIELQVAALQRAVNHICGALDAMHDLLSMKKATAEAHDAIQSARGKDHA